MKSLLIILRESIFAKRIFRKNSCLAIMAMLAMAWILSCIAEGKYQDRYQWEQSSLYPDVVEAIIFSGAKGMVKMDSSKCSSWGSWDVCLGDKPPQATASTCRNCKPPFDVVLISFLSCWNAVAGKKECFIALFRDEKIGHRCEVIIAGADKINIECPTELRLKGLKGLKEQEAFKRWRCEKCGDDLKRDVDICSSFSARPKPKECVDEAMSSYFFCSGGCDITKGRELNDCIRECSERLTGSRYLKCVKQCKNGLHGF